MRRGKRKRTPSLVTRRHFLSLVAMGAASAALPRVVSGQEVRTKPPNFVLILADDLGAKELGCYGNKDHKTPNLDELAKTGFMFKTCWATPLCSPTRVQLMTGRYGFRTGFFNNIGMPGSPLQSMPQYDIGESQITFAEVLKAKGYATAIAGKWQLSGKFPTWTQDCGFDEYCIWAYANYLPKGTKHQGAYEGDGKTSRYWHPCIIQNGEVLPTKPDDYGPDIHTNFLTDFMKKHRDGPFLAYFPMCHTHAPFYPTPDMHPAEGDKMRGGKTNFKANVEYMDKLVGRIVSALDELGLRQNTVVFFVGDNGTGGEGKGTATELGCRVPMIVNCPGTVKPGVISDELVNVCDIMPTMAEFAGAELPKDREIDGRSFAPLLRGEKGNPREWIFGYLADKRMLRDKRWLLEGNGRFYDCGTSRDGTGYKDVTDSNDPEVVAAKKRFEEILRDKPAPDEAYMKLHPPAAGARRKGQAAKTPRGE